MRALLDINVLLALFDKDHVFHERAHHWFGLHVSSSLAVDAGGLSALASAQTSIE